MKELLQQVMFGSALSASSAKMVMQDILAKKVQPVQLGAFLTALQFRNLEAKEIVGFVSAFRERMISVPLDPMVCNSLMDICGTGGDDCGSFNISTTVAFVVAAAGQSIAKHGNRAVSSRSGSFDVLEALGIAFADRADEVEQSLASYQLAFLYAPSFQPVFRELATMRKALGFRTVLNILGPLLNPAQVPRQLIGVYSRELLVPVAEALGELGATEVMIVHGQDGNDEISLCAATDIAHLKNGQVRVSTITPEQFGFRRVLPSDIAGGLASENAQILLRIVSGSMEAGRDIVLLNAAAALYVGGKVEDIHAGIRLAEETIDSGKALHLLNAMRSTSALGMLV